jgi:RNA polymerase sigma-70 factor (ECF subfamily)
MRPLAGQGSSPREAPVPVSDEVLMQRVAQRNHLAYQLLVKRHVNRMLSLAQRVLGRPSDADDVVQEAFLRVWTRAPHWRPGGAARFTTWLYRVVVNLCIDRVRERDFVPLDTVPDVIDPAWDIEDQLHRVQLAERVSAEVSRLPVQQRTALALCYYEGVSNAEAAGVLGISIKALESLLVRARRTLQKVLTGPHGGTPA